MGESWTKKMGESADSGGYRGISKGELRGVFFGGGGGTERETYRGNEQESGITQVWILKTRFINIFIFLFVIDAML